MDETSGPASGGQNVVDDAYSSYRNSRFGHLQPLTRDTDAARDLVHESHLRLLGEGRTERHRTTRRRGSSALATTSSSAAAEDSNRRCARPLASAGQIHGRTRVCGLLAEQQRLAG